MGVRQALRVVEVVRVVGGAVRVVGGAVRKVEGTYSAWKVWETEEEIDPLPWV